MSEEEMNELMAAQQAQADAGWRWSWTVLPLAVVDLAVSVIGAIHDSSQGLLTEVTAAHVFARNQKIFEANTLREIEALEEADNE